jgi:hypothetical protein
LIDIFLYLQNILHFITSLAVLPQAVSNSQPVPFLCPSL